MSNDLTKYEVSAVAQKAGCAWLHEPLAQRFATLCRADLVAENAALKQAHEINADTLKAMQVEIDDWKARALKAEQAQEPFGWYSAKEDDFMLDKIRKTHERLNSHTHRIGKYDLALYTAPPQPAAQELDCATTGVCVRSGLYASPPSAVPVVEQLVEASTMLLSYTLACEGLLNAKPAGQIDIAQEAIAAGQQYLKESGK